MTDTIPPTLHRLLHRELKPTERVVWAARPAPLSRAVASAGTLRFGVPFFSFAVFWTWGATRSFDGPRTVENGVFSRLAYLWGAMFVLAGAAMLLSPLWGWWVARHTLYAVTDWRAIVIEAPLRQATVQSFSGERLRDVVRHEDSSGRGDLIFEREAMRGSRGRTVYRDVGFVGIADVKRVEELLPFGYAMPTPHAQRAAATSPHLDASSA
jgi:hypothetical protein